MALLLPTDEPPVEPTEIAGGEADEEGHTNLRRGPWTVDEDLLLVNYVASHGEGRWNSMARSAGLRRTGKSCRLRWMNYLRPDVRRGNITPQEQLLILDLHSRWGNRWSKIAQHLPGRTDNEIKNYWRTRVQKHARQLNCDVNSKQFKDLMRYVWMPRLLERIRSSAADAAAHRHLLDLGHLQEVEVYCSSSGSSSSKLACQPYEVALDAAAEGCRPESVNSPAGDHRTAEESTCVGVELPCDIWDLDDDFWSLQ